VLVFNLAFYAGFLGVRWLFISCSCAVGTISSWTQSAVLRIRLV